MSQASSFLPLGSVTGIGSLPMTDPDEAVAFVAEHSPRAPFWPQLPQRAATETMIEQVLSPFKDVLRRRDGLPGYDVTPGLEDVFARRLDEARAELDESCAAGWYAFERALAAGAFPRAQVLKGQIAGPITLATQVYVEGRPLVDARGPHTASCLEMARALAWYTTRLALWQIERLQRWRRPVILMLDEPCLSLAAMRPSPIAHHVGPVLKESLTMIRAAGAIAGVHCCARMPTAMVHQAHPDLISFDAHQGLEEFMADPHMQAFMRSGGLVAFGLIPTAPDLSQLHALTMLSRWLESALGLGDIAGLAERSFFTATCGLGLLSVRAARQSFQLAGQLSSSVNALLQRAGRGAREHPNSRDAGQPSGLHRLPHQYTSFPLWRRLQP